MHNKIKTNWKCKSYCLNLSLLGKIYQRELVVNDLCKSIGIINTVQSQGTDQKQILFLLIRNF